MNAQELVRRLQEATVPQLPQRKDYAIACVGAGFIVADCQLKAYRDIGLNPIGITSLSLQDSQSVAQRYGLRKVYPDWKALVEDPEVEIVDIAVPPDVQLDIVRHAVKQKHIRGILCQKPVAMSLEGAREIARLGEEAGIPIAINSNMRYDQSMRALKCALDLDALGEPVLATIEMRAIPHWQAFLKQYPMLEIYSMGIHHVDIFRYLFGDPEKITAVCRTDPRTQFPHTDGIVQFTYQYAGGLMATSLDDVWAWPEEPAEKDIYIRWRVEGLKGMASGAIGWPLYPQHSPSTMRLTSKDYPHQWLEPKWDTAWFPDAFQGTMASLLRAVESGQTPEISARDNIHTIACVEACYASIREERTVTLREILER
ncbi:MAG: Gfo/Idh/MocA family oxidoreductase [Candidatus Limiplasma sp.]|nr:Gfo/Idh/MocA family oxidoreductase [Candidatus Limiplasma sp.]